MSDPRPRRLAVAAPALDPQSADVAHERVPLAAIGVAAALTLAGLAWAKWIPYEHRLASIGETGSYPGTSILAVDGGSGPSLGAGISFLRTYWTAIWPALAVGLFLAAAIKAFVGSASATRAFDGSRRGSIAAALLATPSMMCTCCSAPAAGALRRRGASPSSTVAYWLASPLLNPAVLAFLALVGPWEWVTTRAVIGIALVLIVPALIRRAGDRLGSSREPVASQAQLLEAGAPWERFGKALSRLTLTFVPEYLVGVFALGVFAGPLGGAFAGPVAWPALLGVALAATLMVVPTAGEIPIVLGLAAAGAGADVVGVALIALPAISLPSMAMVRGALGDRALALVAAAVVAGAIAAGLLGELLARA